MTGIPVGDMKVFITDSDGGFRRKKKLHAETEFRGKVKAREESGTGTSSVKYRNPTLAAINGLTQFCWPKLSFKPNGVIPAP